MTDLEQQRIRRRIKRLQVKADRTGDLIDAAAAAEELFDLDELERFAADFRRRAEAAHG